MTAADRDRIRGNLALVRSHIAAAAGRANRPEGSVRLVAVTKQATRSQMESLVEAGCREFAESRPQQLWERAAWFPEVRWHLVGHLQRNKVARTLPLVQWIHSVDSDRLLRLLQEHSTTVGTHVAILLQVNISEEPAKHGWALADMSRVCESLPGYPGLSVRGFMGMASIDATQDRLHREFRSLRELSERLRDRGAIARDCCELSMGMSDDYEIAIEEGATMVRIGTALFKGTWGTTG